MKLFESYLNLSKIYWMQFEVLSVVTINIHTAKWVSSCRMVECSPWISFWTVFVEQRRRGGCPWVVGCLRGSRRAVRRYSCPERRTRVYLQVSCSDHICCIDFIYLWFKLCSFYHTDLQHSSHFPTLVILKRFYYFKWFSMLNKNLSLIVY